MALHQAGCIYEADRDDFSRVGVRLETAGLARPLFLGAVERPLIGAEALLARRLFQMCPLVPSPVQWTRAARTDKGVSAVGNVISLNMALDVPKARNALSRPPLAAHLGTLAPPNLLSKH